MNAFCSVTATLLFLLLFATIHCSSGFVGRIHRRVSETPNLHFIPQHGATTQLHLTRWRRRRKQRQEGKELEDLEEEDFLLADIMPKRLNHERDFFRISTRIQAWDEYVLVSILCTSISYNALENFALHPDHEGIFLYETIVTTMIQSVAGISVLCGLYSTMVFAISILYGKTALGLERDPQLDEFLESTLGIRKRAFWAFSLSLGLFAILSVLVLAEALPLAMHLPVGGLSLIALFIGVRDWSILTNSGSAVYEED